MVTAAMFPIPSEIHLFIRHSHKSLLVDKIFSVWILLCEYLDECHVAINSFLKQIASLHNFACVNVSQVCNLFFRLFSLVFYYVPYNATNLTREICINHFLLESRFYN